jgi:crotonobetainyl-CoA:carnitine CoA-transferase CaiB-like acyl-CoA transferase
VALSLDRPEAQRVLHRLVLRADVVIASFLPGQAERLGADSATLRALNPRLVYGSISGYGPDEPRAGYDAVLQAESGFLHMNGTPDGEPTKMPVALIDLMAAHQLKQAILLALWRRERTGEGATVDVSLYDAALSSLANQGTNYLVAGHDPLRIGSEHPNIVPYGMTFAGSDGTRLLLAVGTDSQFASLVDILGEPGLGSDERFRTNQARVRNRDALRPLLKRLVARRPADELLTLFRSARVPAGAVRTVGEALRDPRSAAVLLGGEEFAGLRQAVFTRPDRVGPFTIESPDPLGVGLLPPPALGEHTASVLKEWAGLTAAELDGLHAGGAVS